VITNYEKIFFTVYVLNTSQFFLFDNLKDDLIHSCFFLFSIIILNWTLWFKTLVKAVRAFPQGSYQTQARVLSPLSMLSMLDSYFSSTFLKGSQSSACFCRVSLSLSNLYFYKLKWTQQKAVIMKIMTFTLAIFIISYFITKLFIAQWQ